MFSSSAGDGIGTMLPCGIMDCRGALRIGPVERVMLGAIGAAAGLDFFDALARLPFFAFGFDDLLIDGVGAMGGVMPGGSTVVGGNPAITSSPV